jgi:hypothetical protein
MALLDDALIHQNYGTIDNVVEPDPRFFDRYYFNLQSLDGQLGIAMGMAAYPNNGVMDGFCTYSTPELQVNVRGSRELVNGDRDSMHIGPLHTELLEPMKRWRYWLDENEYGVSYDFTLTSNFEPLPPERWISMVDNRRVMDWTHFGAVGRIEGWTRLDGKTTKLDPDHHFAVRDRSWGVRPGIVVVEDLAEWYRQANWGTRHNWVCVQLESFYFWYFQTHEQDGTPRFFNGDVRWHASKGGSKEKLIKVERRLNFAPGEHFESLDVDLHLESGRVLTVHLRRLPITSHLRGGNYGGYKGLIHGMKQGPLKVDGERWSPRDSRLNPESMGLQDHAVEVSHESERGYGICEFSYGT